MKFLLSTPILFFTISAFGQSLSNEVIGSSGDFYSATGSNLSWTVGEIMTESYEGSTVWLTQGFHQVYTSNNTTGIDIITQDFSVSVFPNPASDIAYLEIENGGENYIIELYDLQGKLLFKDRAIDANTYILSLLAYERGLYIINVTGESTGKSTSIKIQKTS